MDELYMIEEMMQNQEILTQSELSWISKIDKTMANSEYFSFSPRQREVVSEIYEKFKQRINRNR